MRLDFLKNKFTRKLAAEFFKYRKGIPRAFLSVRYLRGTGLEIGALHNPVYVPFAKVKYVDRMSLADLLKQYPELSNLKVVEPAVIDDGEKLTSVQAGSQNFIIANHFIEHCEDPIGTLKNFAQKLDADGVLYLAVPDRERTFDKRRPCTTFEELSADFEKGPASSRDQNFHDYAKYVTLPEGASEAEIQACVQDLKNRDYSIHFHVWTRDEFEIFLNKAREHFGLPFKILAVNAILDENVFILRKV